MAVILKIEKKDRGVGVFPDVSGRGATVCDAKRDAEAPFGSNPGPAASTDEQMRPRTRATSFRVGVPSRRVSLADDPCVLRVNWAYRPMIPWDNVTISARARITQANKRLRSLTAGGGRHGMAISRGLVVQNGRCSRRSPSAVLRLGTRPQCTQPQAA